MNICNSHFKKLKPRSPYFYNSNILSVSKHNSKRTVNAVSNFFMLTFGTKLKAFNELVGPDKI